MAKITAFPAAEDSIILGGTVVSIKECPLPRVRRFQALWGQFFEEIQRMQAEAALVAAEGGSVSLLSQWEGITNLLLEQPYEILSVLIPGLPKEPFEDEDEGVTIPQIFEAFDKVLELNRIGWLKKLTPFFQNLILNIDPNSLRSVSA